MQRGREPGATPPDVTCKVDVVKTHPRGPLASGRARKKRSLAPASAAALSRRQLERKLAVSVGAAARAARLRAGLTQADVADRVGIASEVYGRLERGKMMPSVPTLFRLCLALQLSADASLGLAVAAAAGAGLWEEDSTDKDDLPEMRRLLRSLRRLPRPQLKLMSLVASAILPTRR
ncbi:helix-turn-helix transcriptional regulator [Corallococcus sp. ZKHCc1 1396]|uniref:Helix-turn-helix transcriptional regulator n=1 Tax=Corallococcus soli TaxID=2710757 RepID=A0ABR9PQQ0_9BACT|nr:helix-turn-helix transcriptional regulator [Corallococcus soli]